MYRVPLLYFLSNKEDQKDQYRYLLGQFNNPISGDLIRNHIKGLVSQSLITLEIQRENSLIQINSFQYEMDRILVLPAALTVSYRIGKRIVMIPDYYREKHHVNLLYPDFPCLVATGGFIKSKTAPLVQHEDIFPLEYLNVAIQGPNTQQTIVNHAHRWGPSYALLIDYVDSMEETHHVDTPTPNSVWGTLEINDEWNAPDWPRKETSNHDVPTQTDMSITSDQDRMVVSFFNNNNNIQENPNTVSTPTDSSTIHAPENNNTDNNGWGSPPTSSQKGSFGMNLQPDEWKLLDHWQWNDEGERTISTDDYSPIYGNKLYRKNCNNRNVF